MANTIDTFLQHASTAQKVSRNVSLVADAFENRLNRDVFLFSSEMYGPTKTGERQAGSDSQTAAATEEARQMSAKLHVYFGTTLDNNSYGRTRSGSSLAHPYARARVYDLRNYNDDNAWGPYMDDGSFDVDWEKVEAIMIVLGYNLQTQPGSEDVPDGDPREWSVDMYRQPFSGVTPNSYVSRKSILQAGDASASTLR